MLNDIPFLLSGVCEIFLHFSRINSNILHMMYIDSVCDTQV